MSGRHEVRISEFHDLAAVAEAVSVGNEVVIRVENGDVALRRRVVDFASGLAHGRARLTKTEDFAFVLIPSRA